MNTIVSISEQAGVPVDRPVEYVIRLTPRQRSALAKLGLKTLGDLLFHFPARYEEIGGLKHIRDLREGEKASVIAEVVALKPEKTWKKKVRLAEGIVRDETGLLQVVWFNQPYVANILKPKTTARFSGRVSRNKLGLFMANPLYEPATQIDADKTRVLADHGGLLPVYPESYGVSSRWLRYQIERLLKTVGPLPETLPPEILARYHLPGRDRAIRAIHGPKNPGEAEAARKRFSFEEVFLIQLSRQRERKKLEAERGFTIEPDPTLLERFTASLPFPLTGAQKRAIAQLREDFGRAHPMARLLEGDVGSGKTIVAAAAALDVVAAGYQVAYLAPTEILARQHFEEFIRRLARFKIRIGLLTGSEARKFPSRTLIGADKTRINADMKRATAKVSKNQLLRWCQNGEIQILIGTHALIEARVKFKKLAFVIVDEQHRFGVSQRRAVTKGSRPHFLSMSATPIPRTLALTIYGDLDLTVLDEMPPGRQPVETQVIGLHERGKTYQFIRTEVERGGQVFVICPRIEEKEQDPKKFASPQKLEWSEVKTVKAEFKKLSGEIFPDLRIGMVHGKLLPKEKEAVMKKFRRHELDILVSTSVVEVGVDVPNASIMMIEGGERFGLATLHQFRGRVGRGGRKSYCFVFTTGQDQTHTRRLAALQKAKNGFELAEYDLEFRGPGELSGRKQWGMSDVGMEALKNIKMVEAAREEAALLIAKDPELAGFPGLRERIGAVTHWE